METFIIARVLHVIGVVLWIGGVAMVTAVLLPAVKAFRSPEERVEFFENVESRFAKLARVYTLLTGLSGFYMLHVLDAWDRYSDAQFWWLHHDPDLGDLHRHAVRSGAAGAASQIGASCT